MKTGLYQYSYSINFE